MAAPLPVEIVNATPSSVQWLPLAGAVAGALIALIGVGVTQWSQRKNDRYKAIRRDRIEQILDFLDAAHAVQHALQKRFYGKEAEDAGALLHELWLHEKAIFLVCEEAVHKAAKEYTQKLDTAVNKGIGNTAPEKYIEGEEWKFLQAARSQMDK
jgi:hypothetical protein